MSSAKVEYVSLSACCAQFLWLRTQLTDYGFHFDKIPMYCDSKAAIAISCNPVQHSRTKHIDVRYHFIKEQVEKGIVELFFVETEYQLADLFTKALSEDMFKYLVRRLNMRCLAPEELELPEVKEWLDEDLDNYHLKELHYSTQCHTQMSMWIISRGVVLLILLMLGISSGSALEDFIFVAFVPDRNIIGCSKGESYVYTHDSTTITIPTTTVPEIQNFASLFGFKRRVSSLESDMSKLKQTNQFVEALSSISGIVDKYLASKVKDTVDVVVQLKSDKLKEEGQVENQDFLNSLDFNMKRIIKEQVKAQTSKIMTKVEKYVTKTLGAEVLVRSTNQPQTSYAVASSLSELELKKILMDKREENNSIDRSDVQKNLYRALLEAYNSDKDLFSSYGEVVTLKSLPKSSGKSVQEEEHDPWVDDLEEPFHQEFGTGNDDVSPVREATDVDERLWNPSGSRTPDREWNQTKTVDNRPPQ
ncbi:hypothetical protein Tco_0328141 [Tanacetum coccineum]